MQATRAHRGLSTARAALRSRGCWPRARRASAPTRSPRRSARASRPPTTCSPACATKASRSAARGPLPASPRVPRDGRRGVRPPRPQGVVDDLLARTHKRAYLAVLRGGQLRIVLERGLQGMPKLPGMNPEIGDNAHALALGKVVLALGPRDAVEQYLQRRAQTLHAGTITDPTRSRRAATGPTERRRRRTRGVRARLLLSRRPVLDHERRFLGAVGISMSRRAFDSERAHLEETLRDVVRFQPSCGSSSRS